MHSGPYIVKRKPHYQGHWCALALCSCALALTLALVLALCSTALQEQGEGFIHCLSLSGSLQRVNHPLSSASTVSLISFIEIRPDSSRSSAIPRQHKPPLLSSVQHQGFIHKAYLLSKTLPCTHLTTNQHFLSTIILTFHIFQGWLECETLQCSGGTPTFTR